MNNNSGRGYPEVASLAADSVADLTQNLSQTTGVGELILIRTKNPFPEAVLSLAAGVKNGSSKTILLVEDEALIALNEKMTLERHEYVVLTATSGEKAVELSKREEQIELVLMDINLGRGMDGTEAARAILAERDLPIVFLSSHTEPQIVEKTEAISSYGYIVKNSGETVLLASIRMAFRLFESRKLAADTFDYSTNGLCLCRMLYDNNGTPIDCEYRKVNGAYEEQTGLRSKEIVGRTVRELYAEDEASEIVALYGELLREGPSARRELHFPPLNGWFEVRAFATTDDEFAFVIENITERRLSEQRLESIFRAAPVGIGIVQDRVLTEANPRLCEMTGYTSRELLGCSARMLYTTEEEFQYVGREKYRQIREAGTGAVETRWTRKDGRRIDIYLASTPLDTRDLKRGVTFTALDITDRKAAEAERRKVEELQDTLLSNISDVVVIIDADAKSRYKSPNIQKLFGWKPEELIGSSVWELLHPQDLGRAKAFFERVARAPGATATLECRYRRKDGEYRWIEFTGTNLLDEPTIRGILGTYHDITGRRETESALERSLEELTKSQTFAHIGSWIWHIQENRVEWSEEMYRIFGVEKEFFTGDLAAIIDQQIHPEDRAAVDRSNASVMNSGVPIPVEYRIIRPTGDVRTICAEAGELETDEEGTPLFLRGIVQDITDRKATEESLWIRQQAVDASMDAIAIADLNGLLTHANPAFLTLWGYSEEQEVLGTDVSEFWELEERAKEVIEALEVDGKWQGVLNGRRKDGSLFPVQLSSSTIRSRNGSPDCMMGVFRDITELTDAQHRLQTILRETHHRIKNNFSVIESLLAVQSRLAEHPETVSPMQNVRSRLTSIRTLYEIFLRTDAQESISADQYLRDLAQRLIEAAGCEEQVSLSSHLDSVVLSASTAFPLGAIVAELITNSLKYAFEPGQFGTVSLRLTAAEGHAVAEVADNGKGMDSFSEAAIPDSFGLSLVRMMVEQIDGTLSMESAPGQGVRATVAFPHR